MIRSTMEKMTPTKYEGLSGAEVRHRWPRAVQKGLSEQVTFELRPKSTVRKNQPFMS